MKFVIVKQGTNAIVASCYTLEQAKWRLVYHKKQEPNSTFLIYELLLRKESE
jgi:hypothetical protein